MIELVYWVLVIVVSFDDIKEEFELILEMFDENSEFFVLEIVFIF